MSAPEPFSFHARASGEVAITRGGRMVTVLRGDAARRFLARVEGADEAARQREMARATGNYKRENEWIAIGGPAERRRFFRVPSRLLRKAAMTSIPRLVLVLIAGLGVAACAALPREELQPSERGEVKTGTNITRERGSKVETYQVDPYSNATRSGRGGS